MKSFRRAAMILTLAAMIASPLSIANAGRLPQTKSDAATVAKLAGCLERSGYSYTKAADNVWVVNYKDSTLGDIHVLVTSAEGLVVMGVVVAQKAKMNVTPEMMHRLLKLTHELDKVKIGLDSDDDLFVRAEVSSRIFDLIEFKADVQQVAAASANTLSLGLSSEQGERNSWCEARITCWIASPAGLSPSNCAITERSIPSPASMVPSSSLVISCCQSGRIVQTRAAALSSWVPKVA